MAKHTAMVVSKIPYPVPETFIAVNESGELQQLENGRFVTLTELIEGEEDAWYGVVDNVNPEDVVFHLSVPVLDGVRFRNESEFIGREGQALRGYRLERGDQITLTVDAIGEDEANFTPLTDDQMGRKGTGYGAGVDGTLTANATFNDNLHLVPIANERIGGRPAIRFVVMAKDRQ